MLVRPDDDPGRDRGVAAEAGVVDRPAADVAQLVMTRPCDGNVPRTGAIGNLRLQRPDGGGLLPQCLMTVDSLHEEDRHR